MLHHNPDLPFGRVVDKRAFLFVHKYKYIYMYIFIRIAKSATMKNRLYNLSSEQIKGAMELGKWQFPSPKGPFVPIFPFFFRASCAKSGIDSIDDNIYLASELPPVPFENSKLATGNFSQKPL